MKIISDREKLAEVFPKMDSNMILVDLLETQKDLLQYPGSSSSYYWLTVRYKVGLLELVKREFV